MLYYSKTRLEHLTPFLFKRLDNADSTKILAADYLVFVKTFKYMSQVGGAVYEEMIKKHVVFLVENKDHIISEERVDKEEAKFWRECDEIFGKTNFVECITWNKRIPKNDAGIGNIHEYVLVYRKSGGWDFEFTMLGTP